MKKIIFPSFLIIGCLSLNSFVSNNYEFSLHNQANNFFTGGAPASRTGAPGEANCTACHGGGANDGSTTSSITFSGSNNEYQPGLTYNMTLSINNGANKRPKFGVKQSGAEILAHDVWHILTSNLIDDGIV